MEDDMRLIRWTCFTRSYYKQPAWKAYLVWWAIQLATTFEVLIHWLSLGFLTSDVREEVLFSEKLERW
jgi:hypothetical protein